MVIASKPTIYDSAKRIAHQLTSTEIQVGFIAESPESGTNKRKFNGKNPVQSSEERQDVASNYSATTTIRVQPRKYVGKLPRCTHCNRHHLGNCSWCSQCNHQHAGDCYICMKCKKRGHTAIKESRKLGRGRAFIIGRREAIQDPLMVPGTK
uniref:Uncharacterized protein n=1 Tax=Lactuca sativa TaxID=4236 RepID=A0A9R1UD74_LACSA|nr:hypothetical protein LSAT_V11C900491930 [Lactuca sativa]